MHHSKRASLNHFVSLGQQERRRPRSKSSKYSRRFDLHQGTRREPSFGFAILVPGGRICGIL